MHPSSPGPAPPILSSRRIGDQRHQHFPLRVGDMLDSIGMGEQLSEQFGGEAQRQQIMAIMELLRGEGGNREIPMFAKADEPHAASVVFVARENYVLHDVSEFGGKLTLFGKVQEQVPHGSSVDLLDLLKVLPPDVRQANAFGNQFKEAMRNLMGVWPKEFGGPRGRDEIIIEGPLVILTPVAAYTV